MLKFLAATPVSIGHLLGQPLADTERLSGNSSRPLGVVPQGPLPRHRRDTVKKEVAVTPEDRGPVRVIDSAPSASEREWFESTVVELLPDLFGTALRLTRNRADAEDLVSDTVTRGWTRLHELSDRARLRGWLFRILTNMFLSARRTEARRGVHESLDDTTDNGFSLFERLHSRCVFAGFSIVSKRDAARRR